MAARTRERVPAQTRGTVHRVFRAFVLLLLLAGFVDLLSGLIPRDARTHDLLDDVRDGRTSVVQVFYASPMEVTARWSTGFAGDKELTHRFETLPSGESHEAEFENLLRTELGGSAGKVTFDRQDPLADLGGLSSLLPVLYWRFISCAWLQWAVLLGCAAVLLDVFIGERRHRAPSAGYWLIACLVFGSGFAAYVWSEPEPLWRRPGSSGSGGMTGWGVVGRTALWSGVVVLIAAAMTWLR